MNKLLWAQGPSATYQATSSWALWFWSRFLKGLYHIWAWQPSLSCDPDPVNKFSFPHPTEAPYEIWLRLDQRFWRRRSLKMVDGHRTDDGPWLYYKLTNEPKGSGELKRGERSKKSGIKLKPEDHWSCSAHLSAEDMLKSAVIEEKKFKHSLRVGADNPLGPNFFMSTGRLHHYGHLLQV